MNDPLQVDTDNLPPGDALPSIDTEIPGPISRQRTDALSKTECPAITARRARRAEESGVDQDPVIWQSAHGANVTDVDGNRFVDLTSAFAVCSLGHNPEVVREAAVDQLGGLTHAMGDVYPADAKIRFCERLADVTPGDLQQSILGLSGSDAVEAALKTAAMVTGRPGAFAFRGAYHGMSHGALGATAYREAFREPFRGQFNAHVQHLPFPNPYDPPFGMRPVDHPEGPSDAELRDACLAHLRDAIEGPASGNESIGAVIVEPVQGRGGFVDPPTGFLSGLREICDEYGLVLIADEIFTGFGRTGEMFACDRESVVPDVMCVGKAMGGGFPISAAIGRPEIMSHWGLSSGEAIHTQTFLGHPLGCAMADAAVCEIARQNWPARVAERAGMLQERLAVISERVDVVSSHRGVGFMQGLEFRNPADSPSTTAGDPLPKLVLDLSDRLRQHGFLVGPAGRHGHVLALTPPFVTTNAQFDAFFDCLDALLAEVSDSASGLTRRD